jgi:4-amino-4-deoxy-L-arabinose transferase-like glycosyltransferase
MSRRTLLVIGVLALVVRVAYVLIARPHIRGISDASTFRLLARNIAAGRGYLAPYDWFFQHHSRPTAEFVPAHPSVLGVATFLGAKGVRAQQLFMGAIGSFTPPLTALLGWRVTADRRIAIGAGVVAAVHPLLFGSDGALMSETVYTLVALVALLCLLDRRVVLAGLATGLTILTRGDAVLFVPIVVLPVLFVVSRPDLRRFARDAAIVAGVVALVVAPWMIRNAARFDGRVVLSNNLGGLILGANCPKSYHGTYLGSWNFRCVYDQQLPGEDEAVNAALMRRQGLEYAGDHAARLAAVVVPARVGRAYGVFHPLGQASNETSEGRVFGTQVAGVVIDWLLVPLFVVGVVALRRRGHAVAALVGPVVFVTVVVALSYGVSRFRELSEPALIVGAVAGFLALTSLAERR